MPDVEPASEATTPTTPTFAERRCWRCLQMFPGEAELGPSPTVDFWLCEACDATLLPGRAD